MFFDSLESNFSFNGGDHGGMELGEILGQNGENLLGRAMIHWSKRSNDLTRLIDPRKLDGATHTG